MTTPTLQSLTPVISPGFLAADTDPAKADWVMLGFPFDGTCSFRPGTRFGPAAVRAASQGVETYSPRQDRDLEDLNFADMGDLDLAIGDAAKALEQIETAAASVLAEGKKLVGIGGEHLVSYPLIKAAFEQYPDLKVVQFDAHADLRDSYLDTGLSHACVMRRVVELLGPEALLQVGIRSGTRDEFAWMKENKTLMASFEQFHSRLLPWLKTNTPIYLTIDVDIIDPSFLPGTGTPEPEGFTLTELLNWVSPLKTANIVGFDVVELSPHYDHSGMSAVTVAKLLRELLLMIG